MKTEKLIWGGVGPLFDLPFIAHFATSYPAKVILDLGCGKGINGYVLRANRDMSNSILVGLDVRNDYLRIARRHNIYNKLIKSKLPKIPLKDKSVDLVLCTEVIEHLPKSQGEKLLSEIERICRGRAIVTTPNIFFHTVSKLDHDKHEALWSVDDFKKSGFMVYGIGFKIKVLYNDKFLKLKESLNYIFTPLGFIFPRISQTLLCVKDFK